MEAIEEKEKETIKFALQVNCFKYQLLLTM